MQSMISKVQTPEQLKVVGPGYYIDSGGIEWIKLNRRIVDHYIIKDLIKLSERMGIKYKVFPTSPYSTILIDTIVYDEYMSDVSEGE